MAYDDRNYEYAHKYLLRVGLLTTGEEAAEALYKAGHAARHLKDPESATGIWQRLVREHADSEWAGRLLKELDGLGLRLDADGKTLVTKPAAS
jgi:hypothetical protein